MSFILLNTADDSIGLVNKASLSQQALMELVIQGITNKEVIRGDQGESAEITEWRGVTIEDDKVTQIVWHQEQIHGSLHLEWLPLTVRVFDADFNPLTGTIDLCHLPCVMERLTLYSNEFVGPIDLQRLPGELTVLDLARNRLNGSVELTRLPGKLHLLSLIGNQFSGSLNLTNLPRGMERLRLQKNLFSGTVDLSLLPSGLKQLALLDNRLSGEVFIMPALFDDVHIDARVTKRFLEVAPLDSKHVPRCWQISLMDQFYTSISGDGKIQLSKGNPSNDYCAWHGVTCNAGIVKSIEYKDKTCGNFDVHSLSPIVEKIQIDRSGQKYALQTRALPRKLQICSLRFNQLFGSIDLRTLPGKLVYLNVSYNNLTGPIALTSLPCSLEVVWLEHNRIAQSVVYYDRLPLNLTEIKLMHRTKTDQTNRIGKVCALHAEMAVKNKEIFKPMPKRKVQ